MNKYYIVRLFTHNETLRFKFDDYGAASGFVGMALKNYASLEGRTLAVEIETEDDF